MFRRERKKENSLDRVGKLCCMILLHLLAYISCASCLTSWLKGKGDDFYRARDYRAAINAYTTALEIDSNLLPAMGNRSACYLHVGELVYCIDDCDAILNRLDKESMHVNAKPKDPQTTVMRLKALARRGAAKCQRRQSPRSARVPGASNWPRGAYLPPGCLARGA